MPETGLNGQKLRDHLRRCWVVYLAGILLLGFINNLVYTVTRPGFSDDETLKLMLVNAEYSRSDEEYAALTMNLLPKVQAKAPQVQVLEVESLAGVSEENPNSAMLLKVQLVSGFGDIYLTDSAAFAMLQSQGACLDLRDMALPGWEAVSCADPETGSGFTGGFRADQTVFENSGGDGYIYLSIAVNTTDQESALAALPLLASAITE